MLVLLIWLFIVVLAAVGCLGQHLLLSRVDGDLFGYQLLLIVFNSLFL